MGLRKLNKQETGLARQVFLNTVPYGAVNVARDLGFQGRPYTLNQMGLDDDDTYVIHAGPDGFAAMHLSLYWRKTLVHELTHVWQSRNSAWPAAYIFRSMACQITEGGDAYNYTPGDAWDSYGVEQQAHIVEDWFNGGQQTSSPLYRYIRDNIRNGKPVT